MKTYMEMEPGKALYTYLYNPQAADDDNHYEGDDCDEEVGGA